MNYILASVSEIIENPNTINQCDVKKDMCIVGFPDGLAEQGDQQV